MVRFQTRRWGRPAWLVNGREEWTHVRGQTQRGVEVKCLRAVRPLAFRSLTGGWEAARLPRAGCPLWATVDCLLRGSKTGSEDSKQKYVKNAGPPSKASYPVCWPPLGPQAAHKGAREYSWSAVHFSAAFNLCREWMTHILAWYKTLYAGDFWSKQV